MRLPLLRSIAAVFAPLALFACADPDPLYVDQAWVRLSPNADSPSAAYFTVHGGPEAVELRGVTSQAAQRLEMHESLMEGGVMKMRAITSIPVPAGEAVAFAPGGKHVMIWGVNPAARQAGKLPLTLMFSNGDRIVIDAAIGQPKESAGGHASH